MNKLLIGDVNKKIDYDLKNLIINKTKDNKVYYIAPMSQIEKFKNKLFEKKEVKGFDQLEFMSLERLSQKHLDTRIGTKKEKIEQLSKELLLKKIIDKEKSNLQVFKNTTRYGVVKKLSNFIATIKSERLYDDINTVLSINEENLKKKLQDINSIYLKYEKLIQDDYYDNNDLLDIFIKFLGETKVFKNCTVIIDRFDEYTKQEFEIIDLFLKNAKESYIVLNHSKKESIQSSKELKEKIIDLLKASGRIYEIKEYYNHAEIKEEISYLSKNLFNYTSKIFEGKSGNIQLFKHDNLYEEVDAVCQEIYINLEQGFSINDIGIVTTSLDDYEIPLKQVLNTFEIPFDINGYLSIEANPLINLVLKSISFYQEGYSKSDFDSILNALTSPINNLSLLKVNKIQNVFYQKGIHGEKIFENKNEFKIIDKYFNNHKEKLSTRKIKVSEFTNDLYDYLINIVTNKNQFNWSKGLNLDEETSYYYTKIWNGLINTFDQIITFYGEKEISYHEYIRILKEGISNIKISKIESPLKAVEITSVNDFKNMSDKKIIFIVGFNDRYFPAKIKDNDLLTDQEKCILKKKKIDLKSNIEYLNEIKKLEYSQLFSLASEKLYINYPLTDLEGTSLNPSIMLESIKKLLGLNVNAYSKRTKFITKKQSVENMVSYLNEKVSTNNALDKKNKYSDFYNWLLTNDNTTHTWIKEALFFDSNKGLDKLRKESKGGNNLKLSATSIDRYFECPFKYFIKYKINPHEPNSVEMNPLNYGNIMHRILEVFGKKYNDFEKVSAEDIEHFIDEEINEIFDEKFMNIFDYSNKNMYFKEKIARVSKFMIQTYVKQRELLDMKLLDSKYEIPFDFDKEGAIAPIIVEDEDEFQTIIRGKIDRVDFIEDISENNKYFIVIDYKTGNTDINLRDFYFSEKIQLLLYVNAVRKNEVYQGYRPLGFYYAKVDHPIVKFEDIKGDTIEDKLMEAIRLEGYFSGDKELSKKIDKKLETKNKSYVINVNLTSSGNFYKNLKNIENELLENLEEKVLDSIKEISKEIQLYNFKIFPTKNACQYCDYKSICQFDINFEDSRYNINYEYENNPKDNEIISKLEGEFNGQK